MNQLFGGGGQSAPEGGFQLTGGGTGAPWTWGVSPFDQMAIDAATGKNKEAMTNRYGQLGLGGSTMEGEDLAQADTLGTALTGEEQTKNVANPALNPALQPPLNQLIQNQQGQQNSSTLSSLAGKALGAGINSLGGSALGAGAGAAADAGTTATLGGDAIDAAAAGFFL